MFNGVLSMSLENTGNKERIKQLKRLKTTLQAVLELRNESEKQDKKVEAEQIETLKNREEVLFLKQRKKKVLLLKQIRKEIINDGSINKQVSLSRLKELMRQSNTLSETEFQKRLSKVIEKKPTIIIIYER